MVVRAGRVERRTSAPSSTPIRLQARELSAGVRELLETFVPRGSRCVSVGRGNRATQQWLLGHGCRRFDVPASQATALPFDDESFDAALLIGVLDQLADPYWTATELRRVLRPGGVLLVTATNISYWRHRLDRATRVNDPRPKGVSPGSLRRLLLLGGFSLVGVEGQDGAFLRDLPLAGRMCRSRGSGLYRVAERFFPSMLGSQVGAFAIRV
jgi:SAM-dependent methyltransferase